MPPPIELKASDEAEIVTSVEEKIDQLSYGGVQILAIRLVFRTVRVRRHRTETDSFVRHLHVPVQEAERLASVLPDLIREARQRAERAD